MNLNKYIAHLLIISNIFGYGVYCNSAEYCSHLLRQDKQKNNSIHIAEKWSEPVSPSFAGILEIDLSKVSIFTNNGATLTKTHNNHLQQEPYLLLESQGQKETLKAQIPPYAIRRFGENTVFDFNQTGRAINLMSALKIKVINPMNNIIQTKLTVIVGFYEYVAEFTIDPSAQPQIITIPIELFKKREIKKDLDTSIFQFEFKSVGHNSLKLKIQNWVIAERDPRHPDIFKYLSEALKETSFNPNTYNNLKSLSQKESSQLMKKMIQNLFNSEIQLKAIEIARNPKYLKYFLDTYNLSLRTINGKLGLVTTVNGNKAGPGFFGSDSMFRANEIPVEAGAFAKEHGEYSHLYQIICMLHGLNVAESKYVIQFISRIILSGDGPSMWANWTVLFDGAGNTLPTEPRYWRDLENSLSLN